MHVLLELLRQVSDLNEVPLLMWAQLVCARVRLRDKATEPEAHGDAHGLVLCQSVHLIRNELRCERKILFLLLVLLRTAPEEVLHTSSKFRPRVSAKRL